MLARGAVFKSPCDTGKARRRSMARKGRRGGEAGGNRRRQTARDGSGGTKSRDSTLNAPPVHPATPVTNGRSSTMASGRRRKRALRSSKTRATKRVTFAGASEVPYLLGSPVVHHLQGNTPTWQRRQGRGSGAGDEDDDASVRTELVARGASVPATVEEQRRLLAQEFARENLEFLTDRDLLPAPLVTRCSNHIKTHPMASSVLLRNMAQFASYLQAVTDEVFGTPDAEESEHHLALAAGHATVPTATLLLRRKELPASTARGYDFGCRLVGVEEALWQASLTELEAMLKERGLGRPTMEELNAVVDAVEVDDDMLHPSMPPLQPLPFSMMTLDMLEAEALYRNLDISALKGRRRRKKSFQDLLRPHLFEDWRKEALGPAFHNAMITKLTAPLESECAQKRDAYLVAILKSRLHRLAQSTAGSKPELFTRLFRAARPRACFATFFDTSGRLPDAEAAAFLQTADRLDATGSAVAASSTAAAGSAAQTKAPSGASGALAADAATRSHGSGRGASSGAGGGVASPSSPRYSSTKRFLQRASQSASTLTALGRSVDAPHDDSDSDSTLALSSGSSGSSSDSDSDTAGDDGAAGSTLDAPMSLEAEAEPSLATLPASPLASPSHSPHLVAHRTRARRAQRATASKRPRPSSQAEPAPAAPQPPRTRRSKRQRV